MSIYEEDVFASLKSFVFDESQLPPPEKYSVKHLHPMYGINHTEETIKQMSESKLGRKNPRYGVTLSSETKRKLSEKLSGSKNPSYGVSPSAETRAKQSAKLKGVPQRRVTCPHCGVTMALGAFTRYHGVKCASHTSTA
jgi:hypothetical protein